MAECRFEKVKDYILPRLVYKDNVGDMSFSEPFLGDIRLIFRILIEETDDTTKSIIVTPKMMYNWMVDGFNYGKVLDQAKKNWFEANVIRSFELFDGMGIDLKAITVEGNRFGATCLIDPYIFSNFVKKSCEFEKDFYIIPSSIHEVLVFENTDAFEGGAKGFESVISEINRDQNVIEEKHVLSYRLLKYNSETKQIELAEGGNA